MNWQGRIKITQRNIKSGNYKELSRLIIRRLFINFVMRPPGFLMAFIILPVFYIVEPFKKIRIAIILSDRIGHFALNTELFLRRRQSQSYVEDKNIFEIFILKQGLIANKQLLTMYKRKILILENQIFYWIYALIDWIFTKTRFHFDLPMADNEDYEFKNTQTSLSFTQTEENFGRKELKTIGINPDHDWFVCIHSRDSTYLDVSYPNKDWNYQ